MKIFFLPYVRPLRKDCFALSLFIVCKYEIYIFVHADLLHMYRVMDISINAVKTLLCQFSVNTDR